MKNYTYLILFFRAWVLWQRRKKEEKFSVITCSSAWGTFHTTWEKMWKYSFPYMMQTSLGLLGKWITNWYSTKLESTVRKVKVMLFHYLNHNWQNLGVYALILYILFVCIHIYCTVLWNKIHDILFPLSPLYLRGLCATKLQIFMLSFFFHIFSERFLVKLSKEGFSNYVEKIHSNCTIFTVSILESNFYTVFLVPL